MATSPKHAADALNALKAKQLPLFADMPVHDPAPDPVFPEALSVGKSDHRFAETLLALSTIPGLGHKSLKALTEALSGNLPDIWQKPATDIETILLAAHTLPAARIAAMICGSANELQVRGHDLREEMDHGAISVIPWTSLPQKLRHIPDDPLHWLFVEGDPAIVTGGGPMVAVVGTRNPSAEGIKATEHVISIMRHHPSLILVSGLAEGIDETAHRESLKHRIKNLAFLGHGIQHVFPESTRELREEIFDQGGAIATEYLPRERYHKAFFVRRNRLQAAISDLVIPVEAAEKSGTAHTLNFALEYKRPVVGLRWAGANGILTTITNHGCATIDITTRKGGQKLDAIFSELAEKHGHDVFSFERTRKAFLRDISTRSVKPDDLERLIKALRDSFREIFEATPDR